MYYQEYHFQNMGTVAYNEWTIIKLINNTWSWGMVPRRVLQPWAIWSEHADVGYPWQLCEWQPHHTPSPKTNSENEILAIYMYFPCEEGRVGWEKCSLYEHSLAAKLSCELCTRSPCTNSWPPCTPTLWEPAGMQYCLALSLNYINFSHI